MKAPSNQPKPTDGDKVAAATLAAAAVGTWDPANSQAQRVTRSQTLVALYEDILQRITKP